MSQKTRARGVNLPLKQQAHRNRTNIYAMVVCLDATQIALLQGLAFH